MKISKLMPILLLGLFALSSCAPKLTPFTQKLYDEQQWSDEELKKIQFYTSDNIVLYRELSKGESQIVSGEIKIRNGKKVDEVVIKKGTPGVMLFRPRENKFAISFEANNDDRFLIFGTSNKRGGQYRLQAKDWKRRTNGKVIYEGKEYYTNSVSSYATLMVDLKRVRNTEVRSRTARGRTVD